MEFLFNLVKGRYQVQRIWRKGYAFNSYIALDHNSTPQKSVLLNVSVSSKSKRDSRERDFLYKSFRLTNDKLLKVLDFGYIPNEARDFFIQDFETISSATFLTFPLQYDMISKIAEDFFEILDFLHANGLSLGPFDPSQFVLHESNKFLLRTWIIDDSLAAKHSDYRCIALWILLFLGIPFPSNFWQLLKDRFPIGSEISLWFRSSFYRDIDNDMINPVMTMLHDGKKHERIISTGKFHKENSRDKSLISRLRFNPDDIPLISPFFFMRELKRDFYPQISWLQLELAESDKNFLFFDFNGSIADWKQLGINHSCETNPLASLDFSYVHTREKAENERINFIRNSQKEFIEKISSDGGLIIIRNFLSSSEIVYDILCSFFCSKEAALYKILFVEKLDSDFKIRRLEQFIEITMCMLDQRNISLFNFADRSWNDIKGEFLYLSMKLKDNLSAADRKRISKASLKELPEVVSRMFILINLGMNVVKQELLERILDTKIEQLIKQTGKYIDIVLIPDEKYVILFLTGGTGVKSINDRGFIRHLKRIMESEKSIDSLAQISARLFTRNYQGNESVVLDNLMKIYQIEEAIEVLSISLSRKARGEKLYPAILLYIIKLKYLNNLKWDKDINRIAEASLADLEGVERAEMCLFYALSYEKQKNFRKARKLLLSHYKKDKGNSSFYIVHIVNSYLKEGKKKVCERIIKLLLKDKIVADTYIMELYGYLKLLNGQSRDAEKLLHEALQLTKFENNIFHEGLIKRHITTVYFYSNPALSLSRMEEHLPFFEENRLFQFQYATLVNQAIIYNNIGKYSLSLDYYNKANSLLKYIKEGLEKAIYYINASNTFHNLGEMQLALGCLHRAEEYLRFKKKWQVLQIIYNNLGFTYLSLGEVNLSIEYFSRGLREEKKVHNPRYRIIILENLADIYSRRGEFRRAIKVLKAIQDYISSRHITLKEKGILYNIKGILQESIGATDNALNLFKKSFELLKGIQMESEAFEAYSSYQNIMIEKGDFKEIDEWFSKNETPVSPLLFMQYKLLEANYLLAKGKTAVANEIIRELKALFEKLPHSFMYSEYLEILVRTKIVLEKDYQGLLGIINSALTHSAKTGNKLMELHWLLRKVNIQRTFGFYTLAWKTINEAKACNENLYNSLPDDFKEIWGKRRDSLFLHKELIEMSFKDFNALSHLPDDFIIPKRALPDDFAEEIVKREISSNVLYINEIVEVLKKPLEEYVISFNKFLTDSFSIEGNSILIYDNAGNILYKSEISNVPAYSIIKKIPEGVFYMIEIASRIFLSYKEKLASDETFLWISSDIERVEEYKKDIEIFLKIFMEFYFAKREKQILKNKERHLDYFQNTLDKIDYISRESLLNFILPNIYDSFKAEGVIFYVKTAHLFKEEASVGSKVSLPEKYLQNIKTETSIMNDDKKWYILIPILYKEEISGILAVICSEKVSENEYGSYIRYIRYWLNSIINIRNSEEDYKYVKSILAEEVRLKNEFVAVASHELRTPLVLIQGYIELLEQNLLGELNNEQKDALKIMHDNTKRLLHLADEIITLSKVGKVEFSLSPRQIQIDDFFNDIQNLVLPTLQNRNISFSYEREGSIEMILADEARLHQAAVNILNNAIKYTPDGGQILIRVSSPNPAYVIISISDSGIGIPREEQERVFSPFYKIEKNKYYGISEVDNSGGGLGLAITKNIIEAHGGRIWLESEVGKGTTFYFLLPKKLTADFRGVWEMEKRKIE
ncbi:MAG: tetratricopeptide repeat-containing sensor histidine kinase [Candidatus Coatesbacteria bacterium]|nr:tetratricopeptide repeat-containing sensor histidine kinase [Candidatus Coatesbacteria bacterium]